jgi:hypothetical protein
MIIGVFIELQKATISCVLSVLPSVCPFVRMKRFGSHGTDFFFKVSFGGFFENLSRKFRFIQLWQE